LFQEKIQTRVVELPFIMGCGASTTAQGSENQVATIPVDAAASKAETKVVIETVKAEPLKGMPKIEDVPRALMTQYLERLFEMEDENGDGVLQPQEFANLLGRSGFAFSKELIEKILKEADVNNDGVIDVTRCHLTNFITPELAPFCSVGRIRSMHLETVEHSST